MTPHRTTDPGSPTHIDEGNGPLLAVLKSSDFGRAAGPNGELPYRIDLLREHGYRLGWTDRNFRLTGVRRRMLDGWDRATVPTAQAVWSRGVRSRAVATVAVFESEGHGLALARAVSGRRGPALVIVSCWLAHLVRTDTGGRRRALYRRLYRGVDAVTVFSENQRDTLVELLGMPAERIHPVRFGVDLDELAGLAVRDSGRVVAAGRDLGRDWATLAAAAAGSGWGVDLLTRPAQVDGIDLPAEITLHGRVPRRDYLLRLAGAGVVVLPSEVREYPTGQTVLLEAMALGKACVVSDTPAMREYVEDGVTAVLVPPHDPAALRAAVDRLLGDPSLRERIGAEAARREAAFGGARTMWSRIAEVIGRTTDSAAAPVSGTGGVRR